ncbi:hypothetical protein BGW41_001871 [Actinomortierella wolfii]|nr:hypothetical protein BGW41_001871 [Actinomortierella wolfii]
MGTVGYTPSVGALSSRPSLDYRRHSVASLIRPLEYDYSEDFNDASKGRVLIGRKSSLNSFRPPASLSHVKSSNPTSVSFTSLLEQQRNRQQHLQRLSLPYVQAIRKQQQQHAVQFHGTFVPPALPRRSSAKEHITTLSSIEEASDGSSVVPDLLRTPPARLSITERIKQGSQRIRSHGALAAALARHTDDNQRRDRDMLDDTMNPLGDSLLPSSLSRAYQTTSPHVTTDSDIAAEENEDSTAAGQTTFSVPAQTERRWSRVLKMIAGSGGSEPGVAGLNTRGRRRGAVGQDEASRECKGKGSNEAGRHGMFYSQARHQVDSGSLASFRGLDASPTLRVMNPDDDDPDSLRVDTPSLDDTTYLMLGSEYVFTNKTPVAASTDPRAYVDGMLATQKIIAAPIVPIDRQSWPAVDATRSYFGRNRNTSKIGNGDHGPLDYGKQRIEDIPNVLRAGMRKLVLDLWWDPMALGWQICPRLNRDSRSLQTLSFALQQYLSGENASKNVESSTSSISPLGSQPNPQQRHTKQSRPHKPSAHAPDGDPAEVDEFTDDNQATTPIDDISMHPEIFLKHVKHDKRGAHGEHRSSSDSTESEILSPPLPTVPVSGDKYSREATLSTPVLVSNSSIAVSPSSDLPASPTHHRGYDSQRLVVSKSRISSYDSSQDTDKTVDGITCSTGDDLAIMLQALQSWVLQTSDDELVDVLLIVINLNEFNGTSTRPNVTNPQPTTVVSEPTPTSLSSPLTELEGVISPNTNSTVMAVLPNMISLRQIFDDAFPHMIYTPHQLQLDRDNLNLSWWKDEPVGLDYYNTTMDPASHVIRSSTGWPTTKYLTDVLKTRVMIGFGNINLSSTSKYNITDDLDHIFAPGVLDGISSSAHDSNPSTNKPGSTGFLKYSSSLDPDRCHRPMPNVLMEPTGAEGNWTQLTLDEQDTSIQYHLRWSFANLADSSDFPWTYQGIKLATTCGYSIFDQGGGSELTISDQAASTGWSWDLDQPPLSEIKSRNKRCGVMQSNGRWAVQNCNLKLPVACRKIGASGQWIVHKAGAANYRDVSCPSGYKFDVPRTARENQALYQTLLQHLNATAPAIFNAVMRQQNLQQWRLQEMSKAKPLGVLELYDPAHVPTLSTMGATPAVTTNLSTIGSNVDHMNRDYNHNNGINQDQLTALLGGSVLQDGTAGMIWIDISSWQTAGCWVPGGTEGLCPYKAPDHTAAMQEIIKVSTIGGVIMLILAGAFLYVKCRRNIRLRKASRRRSAVRSKIMRTEVETIPA